MSSRECSAEVPPCSLDRLLEATRDAAAPGERYGVIAGGVREEYGVRVVVGGEVVVHEVDRSLNAAIGRALDVVEGMASDRAIAAGANVEVSCPW